MTLWRVLQIQRKLLPQDKKRPFKSIIPFIFLLIVIASSWYVHTRANSFGIDYATQFNTPPLFTKLERLYHIMIHNVEALLGDRKIQPHLFDKEIHGLLPLIELFETAILLSERQVEARIYLKEDLEYLKELTRSCLSLWQHAFEVDVNISLKELGLVLFKRINHFIIQAERHNKETFLAC